MINIIAAVAANGVIGSGGKIPWYIPQDMHYFRRITSGHIIIMGRRSFEEIGRPLPDRLNIVVSRSKSFRSSELITAKSLGQAVELAEKEIKNGKLRREIFLCGGAGIYREGLGIADRLYLTELDREYEGDVYFPHFSGKDFRLVSSERCDEAELCFNVYLRNDKNRRYPDKSQEKP